jgi:hypothetical protein
VDRNWKGWTRRRNKREIHEESEWERVDQRKHRKGIRRRTGRGSEQEEAEDRVKLIPNVSCNSRGRDWKKNQSKGRRVGKGIGQRKERPEAC